MGKISGVSTGIINNVDGFYTTQTGGGGGLTAPALGTNSGVQVLSSNISSVNPGLNASFNRTTVGLTSYSHTDFVRLAAKKTYKTFFAVTSDGKLHYNTSTGSWMSGATTDSEWHEDTSNPSGTSGNWTDVATDDQSALAIRGGDVCFRGYGNYRQRGDGSTGSSSIWIKTYDGSTDAASRVYMGYRVSYLVTAAGKLLSSGYNYDGQTGVGTSSGQTASWTDITPAGVTVASFGFGYRCAKFIDQNGDVWSFGDNGQLHSGPLWTSSSDRLSPTQSTNTQPFLGAEIIGGACGDMFSILDTNGQLWVQGEGGGRINPAGGTTDKKNAWYTSGSAGDYVGGFANGTTSSSDQIVYYIKNDDSLLLSGLDAQNMTASHNSTGSKTSGTSPYNIFTAPGNKIHMVAGNVSQYIVVYKP